MKMRRFPIVCLCGSVRFKKEFLKAAQDLEFEGKIVVMPNVFSKVDGITLTNKQLDLLVNIHNEKIRISDEVYIIDAPGNDGTPYIGVSTKDEIKFSKKLNKPVRYMSKEYIKSRKRRSDNKI
jgi:hypothetical protein